MKSFIIMIASLLIVHSAQAEWKTDTELGFVSQSGNANQENTFFNTRASKTIDKNSYEIYGSYINSAGETNGVDARLAESVNAGLKYTHLYSEVLGFYAGVLWEKNRFAGFDERYSGDLGLRFDILKSDNGGWTLFNETGYRYRTQYAYEVGPGRGENVESNFGRIYFEGSKALSKTSNFRMYVEGLYDFDDSDNYEVNFEPSVDVALGEFLSTEKPARVSLKVAYKGMFDNVPALDGLKKFDSIFSTSLKVVY